MMDQIDLLEKLEKVAGVCRRIGLSGLPPAGRNLLRPLIGDRLSVRVQGFEIAASLEHRHYLQALRHGEIESLTTNLFASVIRPGMVVLDIGAFVGWYTLLAARQTGEHGKVYAFESDPRNYDLLNENLRINKMDGRVTAMPRAVSDKAGPQQFVFPSGDLSRSRLFPAASDAYSTTVTTVVLDNFLDRNLAFDVIRIDIEGGELKALHGMRETIARAAPTVKLFVGCHSGAPQHGGDSVQSLIAALRQLDFAIFMIDENRPGLKPVDLTFETTHNVNLFCIRV